MKLQEIVKVAREYKVKYEEHNEGFNKLYAMLCEYKEECTTSDNSDYAKLPDFKEVYKKAYDLDGENMTVATFYECLKELGNFA